MSVLLRVREILRSLFWNECSAYDERPKHGEQKCQRQKQSNIRRAVVAQRGATRWTNLGLDAFGTATEDSPDGHRKPGCSVWVFEIFRQRRSSATNRGCEYHFLATSGLGETAGAAATRTMVPVVRESAGFTITLSDGVTPWTISIVVPKSRPTLMS